MRICSQCRLITADDPTCRECGAVEAGPSGEASPAQQYAQHLQHLSLFTVAMFLMAFMAAFSVTPGGVLLPALAAGLFAAGFIGDLWLVWLIYRTATLYQEGKFWTVGAVLTFPFGTVVFAWLLARRVRAGAQPAK